ncbi:MAG: glycosyltransferase family 4 protein [Bradyrhizobium sp.]|nr:glycosyltransferase family 4 protein [Bradyrhizobium sp.]
MSRLSNITILMTADTVGGVWTYASALASALSELQAQVYLMTMGPRARADQREMLPPSVQVIESGLALEWQDPAGEDLERAREYLGAVEQRVNPDVIHLNSYREATFPWHAPVVVVAHSCVNSWAMACTDGAFLSEPKWRRYTRLVAEGLDHADTWVAPTVAFGDVVGELYQPRSPRIVIRNGAPCTGGSPPADRRLILAAGRMWDEAKNLALLAAAASDIDWPVFVAGPTAKSAGGSGIKLLGELSHSRLAAHMRRAAIFVSPARYEPFGLSVLEAASAGCALVLSDIRSFRELWNGAALFVAPDDADGLRAALSDLCCDKAGLAWLQRAALARAKHYSLRQMSGAYARLYRALCTRRPGATSRAVEVCA